MCRAHKAICQPTAQRHCRTAPTDWTRELGGMRGLPWSQTRSQFRMYQMQHHQPNPTPAAIGHCPRGPQIWKPVVYTQTRISCPLAIFHTPYASPSQHGMPDMGLFAITQCLGAAHLFRPITHAPSARHSSMTKRAEDRSGRCRARTRQRWQ